MSRARASPPGRATSRAASRSCFRSTRGTRSSRAPRSATLASCRSGSVRQRPTRRGETTTSASSDGSSDRRSASRATACSSRRTRCASSPAPSSPARTLTPHANPGLRALRLQPRLARSRVLRRSRQRPRPDARVLRARLEGVCAQGPRPLARGRHPARGDLCPPAAWPVPDADGRRDEREGQEGPQGLPCAGPVRRQGCVGCWTCEERTS